MKKISLLLLVIVALFTVGLSSCSSSDKKVDAFVEQLNGPEFKQAITSSGIFASSEAKVADDSTVELVFTAVPGFSFKDATQAQVEMERQNMISNFKAALPTDPALKEGLEAMKDSGKSLKVKFVGNDGSEVSFTISPAEVLGE